MNSLLISPTVRSTSKVTGPLVSIVTPSYNQAIFIEKTIRSVIFQDYQNLEYVVCDAASKDGTDQIMAKYADKMKIVSERDDGQADAIDKGFKMTSGAIMAYINSDDCYMNEHVVSRVVELFEENPTVDVIVGKREYIDENGYFVLNYPYQKFNKQLLLESCYIPQEATFWRRSIYEKAGNMVDKTFNFAMDYDLWLRFLAADANFMTVDEYFGLFRWYPGQKSAEVWQKHGLPEIAKLQTKHLGRALPEEEMVSKYQEFFYGSNRLTQNDIFKKTVPYFQMFTAMKKAQLSPWPRDGWVFNTCFDDD